jgi:hypothetical protein
MAGREMSCTKKAGAMRTAYLQASRRKLLDKRGRERVDRLIDRFAVETETGQALPNGEMLLSGVDYNCMTDDDGDETDIEIGIRIDAANLELAASEFRACGFVVSKPPFDLDDDDLAEGA